MLEASLLRRMCDRRSAIVYGFLCFPMVTSAKVQCWFTLNREIGDGRSMTSAVVHAQSGDQ